MRQVLTPLVLLVVVLVAANETLSAQAIERVQRPLITKTTATWCGPCGSWGWDLFEDLVDDNADRAILMATHYSGELRSTAGTELSAGFGATGQPQFFLSGSRVPATSSSAQTARGTFEVEVTTLSGMSPLAGVTAYQTGVSAGVAQIRADVEFFSEARGDYYLAVYAVEEGVVNAQASRGAEAVHKRVLRTSIGATYGADLGTGDVYAAGATASVQAEIEWPSEYDLDNVRLVAVLWERDGDDYAYVNGAENLSWRDPVGTRELDAARASLANFSEGQQLTTTLTAHTALTGVRVSLLDAGGRVVGVRELGEVPSGKTVLTWADAAPLAVGYYAVRLESASGRLVRPAVVR